ncbi:MAG: deoxyguanosinetriphosphate triphosphohydrolase [Caldisericota bacterium]|jgi:dGTPase|nr:deoxyguanosinetriphosphate triphosphohydrolase [Caldisericota bacterium]
MLPITNYRDREGRLLSQGAAFGIASKGRVLPEGDDGIRSPFQKDRDRIIHSSAFRRLQYKTQVFIAPRGDEIRTRLTHTLEVAQLSRSVADALGLNEDLVEAIALGHDLGHAPFGHTGEGVLDAKLRGIDATLGFDHATQSLRVVDVLEHRERGHGEVLFGLNLTFETRNGIASHSKGLEELRNLGDMNNPQTLEGQVVRLCDRVAYVNHDLDDAIQAGIVDISDVPKDVMAALGDFYSKRLETMVLDIIQSSAAAGTISMSSDIRSAMDALMMFLKDRVYMHSVPKREEGKARELLSRIFDFCMEDALRLEPYLREHPVSQQNRDPVSLLQTDPVYRARVVADYVASMTDRMALQVAGNLILPIIYV